MADKQLSVRETEKLVQRIKNPAPVLEKLDAGLTAQANNLSHLIANKLSSEVKIKIDNSGEGKIIVSFSSLDEVDWLLKKLG